MPRQACVALQGYEADTGSQSPHGGVVAYGALALALPTFMAPTIREEQPLWRVRVARSCRTIELRASYAVEAKCLAAKRLHIHVQRLVVERVWDPKLSRFGEVA
jgi:hypothetical protein